MEVPLTVRADSLRRPVRIVLCARVTPATLRIWAPMQLPVGMALRCLGSPDETGFADALGPVLNPSGFDARPGLDDAGTRRARASGAAVVDMGECLIGQAVERPLVLFNPSSIPIRYGFVRPGRGVCFDGDGLGILLPREVAAVQARFAPQRADSNTAQPVLQTSSGQRLSLTMSCHGIRPLLVPSVTRIALPPLAVGDETYVLISLRANPKEAAKFEVQAPRVRDLLMEAFGAEAANDAFAETLASSVRLS